MRPVAHNTAQHFVVTDAYRGLRLDRFLQQMMPRMSRTSIQQAIEQRVRLASGAEPKASRRPAVGEVVTIAPRERARVEAIVVPVLAEGQGWVVVDKPAGMDSTPSSRRPGADVMSLLGIAPAHRLDRETSGCLLLTRDAATARHFDVAFRERRVEKQYLAVIAGEPAADAFTIEAPLGPDGSSRVPRKMAVVAGGAPAATRIEILVRHGERTLVRARPTTGRRHQLRVHLAHIGHAIVGDLLYGGDERRFIRHQMGQSVDVPDGLVAGRHLLHAHRLMFCGPSTQPIEVTAPCPPDFVGFEQAVASIARESPDAPTQSGWRTIWNAATAKGRP